MSLYNAQTATFIYPCNREEGHMKTAEINPIHYYASTLTVLLTIVTFVVSAEAATWISGSNSINEMGIYGDLGVPDPCNFPGARRDSISWTDSSDNLWLFGGYGYGEDPNTGQQTEAGLLNDLWKFDGANWAWMNGPNVPDDSGHYGTKGVADPLNLPPSRRSSISWSDSNDNLWLFSGWQGGGMGGNEFLSDLWRFDGTNWTWVSGPNTTNHAGVYGTLGVADGNNVPSARGQAVSWIDANDDLWLFGGWRGGDMENAPDTLSDLWKFDGENWTWMGGPDTVNHPGVYGALGVPDTDNIPPSRAESVSWTDSVGNFWLFGGRRGGFKADRLNDLWKYDGTYWTWISGASTANQTAIYGTKGVPAPANVPGARFGSNSWIGANDNLYLFGGNGYDNASSGYLSDLWRYDGANWTWIAGNDYVNAIGVYGDKGISDPNYWPGGRSDSVVWIDSDASVWLFGGYGYLTGTGSFNDMWLLNGYCARYVPADINRDCRVDMFDFSMLAGSWLEDHWCNGFDCE